jgi:hypothetical protein
VDRINSVIDLLRDEVKDRSKAPSKQVDKVCESFYGYVQSSSIPLQGLGGSGWRMTDRWYSDLEKLLTAVMEEQEKDKTYIKRFLKSSSIQGHIAGFKQKLEDGRGNLTVSIPSYYLLFTQCCLTLQNELTL